MQPAVDRALQLKQPAAGGENDRNYRLTGHLSPDVQLNYEHWAGSQETWVQDAAQPLSSSFLTHIITIANVYYVPGTVISNVLTPLFLPTVSKVDIIVLHAYKMRKLKEAKVTCSESITSK